MNWFISSYFFARMTCWRTIIYFVFLETSAQIVIQESNWRGLQTFSNLLLVNTRRRKISANCKHFSKFWYIYKGKKFEKSLWTRVGFVVFMRPETQKCLLISLSPLQNPLFYTFIAVFFSFSLIQSSFL